ncbi:MAG: PP2C family protein-serine/threonine phosphatase [Planctomycetota bacterium]|jgi:hypothetical protein
MQTQLDKTTCSATQTGTINVLFAGNRPVSDDLTALFETHGYAWDAVSIDELENTAHNREIIGCLVVDGFAIDDSQISGIQGLLKDLDAKNVAVLMHHCPDGLDIAGLELAGEIESPEFDALWARIDSTVKTQKRLHEKLKRTDKFPDIHPKPDMSEDLPEQLEMAGRVQRNFLPTQLPNSDTFRWAAMYRPADFVSGDIYDIARIDEHHIGFYLADAVGHSMPAALLTMFLKQATVMRQTIGHDYYVFQPWEVMRTLNQRMCEQELAGCLFATSAYGLLNTETLTLKYARAGHPYPVLIRGNRIVQLESRGGLLGVFDETEFQQQTLQLYPGDKIFIYSDGGEPMIGEDADGHGFVFTEAFQEICHLPIEDMLAAYNEMAENHTFGPGEIDDVTAIGLEIL